MKYRVFVYGSLLSGFGNHSRLETSKYVGNGWLNHAAMYDLGAFPAVHHGKEHQGGVVGEVYEVDDLTLGSLDALEGHPNFYRRKLLPIEMATDTDGKFTEPFECWVYCFSYTCQNLRVWHGDWRRWKDRPDQDDFSIPDDWECPGCGEHECPGCQPRQVLSQFV